VERCERRFRGEAFTGEREKDTGSEVANHEEEGEITGTGRLELKGGGGLTP